MTAVQLVPSEPSEPLSPIFPTEYDVFVVLSVYVVTILVQRYWEAATEGIAEAQDPVGAVVPLEDA